MSGHLNNEDSEFVSHLPCKKCGSSDANSLYTDGHTYCFSCNTYANTNENISINMENTKKDKINLLDGTPKPLVKRNLTLETCVFWNYYIGEQNNQTVQIANYYNKAREPVFQKIRYKDKTFKIDGNRDDYKIENYYYESLQKTNQSNFLKIVIMLITNATCIR